MKKTLLLLTALLLTGACVQATEPLLLDPLPPAIWQGVEPLKVVNENGVEVTVPNATYEATYVPAHDPNMVPQNAAAEGKPVKSKRTPRVRIETKQGRQTNTQWNPGGKGTKSFF